MKIQTKKAFTLAELLIVIGIIAVLIAIVIPLFTSELSKARIETDHANIRAAWSLIKSYESLGEYIDQNPDLSEEDYPEQGDQLAKLWFSKDGKTIGRDAPPEAYYRLKGDCEDGNCTLTSVTLSGEHKKNYFIEITFNNAEVKPEMALVEKQKEIGGIPTP